jgi:hypothetical protein
VIRSPLLLSAGGVMLLSAVLSWLVNGGLAASSPDPNAERWSLASPAPPARLERVLQRVQTSGFLGTDDPSSAAAGTEDPGAPSILEASEWSLLGTVRDAAGPRAIVYVDGQVRQIGVGSPIGAATRVVGVTEDSIIVEENDQQRTVRLFAAP